MQIFLKKSLYNKLCSKKQFSIHLEVSKFTILKINFYFIFFIFTVQRRVITIRRWAKIATEIIRGSERVICKFGASPSFGNQLQMMRLIYDCVMYPKIFSTNNTNSAQSIKARSVITLPQFSNFFVIFHNGEK